jgi:isopentenyldiphosphate isomerase
MEKMDIYDENRRPTGRTLDRERGAGTGEYLTVVHLCLFDSSGRMLIQRRHHMKHAFPDLWDLSAGGGVKAGETSREAVCRETHEELGLTLELDGVRPYLTVNFEDGFDDIYVVQESPALETLRLQPDEVSAVRWATLDEASALLRSGAFVPYHESFLRLMFEMRGYMGFLRKN